MSTETPTPLSFTIELTREEFDQLAFLLGYAHSAAKQLDSINVMEMALAVSEAVNRNNPHYQQFEITRWKP